MSKIKVKIKSSKTDKSAPPLLAEPPLDEHRGESLCDGTIQQQKVCKDRDAASRERSEEKRRVYKRTFPGKSDMDSLAHGVVEGKEKKLNITPGNPRHDNLGRFSTKGDNTSWGLGGYGSAPSGRTSGKSQMSPGSNQRRITKHPCGSKSTGPKGGEGKHKWKCKDKTKAFQEGQEDPWIKIKKSAFERLIGYSLDQLDQDPDEFELLDEENETTKLAAACKSRGYMNFKDWLIRLNFMNKAEGGDLFPKEK